MTGDLDLPIAVRRTRRSLGLGIPTNSTENTRLHDHQYVPSSPMTTPSRTTKARKHVRFSDPGPLITTTPTSSTGLTPMIRRTSLQPSSRRRHSTPCTISRSGSGSGRAASHDADDEADAEVVHVTPLRQVLSGRVQRRIRRNGLSEEMNAIEAEKRQRLRDERDEVERLRAEVAARDGEIARLRAAGLAPHGGRTETDRDRVAEVEELQREVDALRSKLLAGRDHAHGSASAVGGGLESPAASSSPMNWTVLARDPFSAEEYTTLDMEVDGVDGVDVDNEFAESSLAEMMCSTPSRSRARGMLATPPTTSPAAARSSPPFIGLSHVDATPQSHAVVQADLPDVERDRLHQEELASLHLELAKMTAALDGYTAFSQRLAEGLSNFAPADTTDPDSVPAEAVSPCAEVEARISTLLRTLSDRSAALLHLVSSIGALGFPGSDAEEMVRSITTAFRTARLELEYLTPGEITLPLTASGAAVLDLLLDRLRDLGKKVKEGDENIDEYHALELSLRQQLSARVDVTDALTREVTALKKKLEEREGKIEEQAVGLERLKGAVKSYARDVGELDELVRKLEGEKTAAAAELEERLKTQATELEGKLAELEEKHAGTLRDMRKSHKAHVAGMNKSHGSALALRDARVAELRGEIERVNASLRAAHETVQKLRVENAKAAAEKEKLVEEKKGLVEGAEEERRKAKEVVDGMRAELERVVRMSEGLLATPRKKKATGNRRDSALGDEDANDEVALVETPTTASRRGSFLSGDLAKRGSRKRRRYDSGLGFLDEEEVDA